MSDLSPAAAPVPADDAGVPAGPDAGARMLDFVAEAYPWLRSLTGDGVRRTLAAVAETVPLDVVEVPSGTPVLDWEVPPEWSVRAAHVVGPDGRRRFDVADHSLHLVGYSAPFRGVVDLDELRAHLHTLPDRPGVVPYRTSYHERTWGFCATADEVAALEPGPYEVVVDTELFAGSLTYGELVVPGEEEGEVLVTTHTCHPSLANDNLAGIAVAAEVARRVLERPRRFTHRFLFMPGTIGAITWLATHPDVVPRVHCGLALTGLGDAGPLAYKRSRRGATVIDRVAEVVVGATPGGRMLDWSPYGYDERQFCSPGYDLAFGRLSRSVHGEFPEYHTSADDLSFVSAGQLAAAADAVEAMLDAVGANRAYRNLSPYGEPQLGARGLYRSTGGAIDARSREMAVLWVLSLSDGDHDLVDVARASGLGMGPVAAAAEQLVAADLLAPL